MSKIRDDYRDELVDKFTTALTEFENELKADSGFLLALNNVEEYSKSLLPIDDADKFGKLIKQKIGEEYGKAIKAGMNVLFISYLAEILADQKYPV